MLDQPVCVYPIHALASLMQNDARYFILGDNALLYIPYAMLIWAPLIPATR